MKYLTKGDLLLLVKLVNQASDSVAAIEDVTLVVRRQDREFKALPPETMEEMDAAVEPVHYVRTKLKAIRNRLVSELQEC